jgi:heme oxygenase (biliverdin-IX-beta and delta-forming)
MTSRDSFSRRSALRSSTAVRHAELETVVGALGSRASYVRYLRGMQAFRAPYEAALSELNWRALWGDWRPTFIAESLLDDLNDIGVAPITSRPFDDTRPVIADRSSAFGVLYVLEGSSLGARLLYSEAKKLGLSEAFGARHLARQSSGFETWRGFQALLETAEGLELSCAVQAANRAFEAARISFLKADADEE